MFKTPKISANLDSFLHERDPCLGGVRVGGDVVGGQVALAAAPVSRVVHQQL